MPPLQRDFTHGSIPKHLIMFSLPMFLGNLLQGLYSTVDSIWVGRFLGPTALGAVSVSMPVIFGLVAMVMGLAVATTTMVAQYRGAQDEGKVQRTTANSLLLLTILGIVISIVGIYVRYPILRLINTPPDIAKDAADYLAVFLMGTVFTFLYNGASAVLRGVGDSRTPVTYLVWATVLNIVLDPLFILGVGPFPRWGIAGAAFATLIAQVVAAVLSIRHLAVRTGLLHLGRSSLQFDKHLTLQTLRIGLPAGVQQTIVSFAGLAVASSINHFGPMVVAASGAASRLDQFAFMPSFAISLSVSALVGQNLGAGKQDRVREIVKWSCLLATLITGVVSLIAFLTPQLLLQLFSTDPAVLGVGSAYLRVMAFAYIPFALMFVFTGVLRGAGDTVPSMFLTLAALWLVRVPLVNVLSGPMGLGSNGIWLGIAASAVLGLLFNWLYYRTGRWKRARVVATPIESEPIG